MRKLKQNRTFYIFLLILWGYISCFDHSLGGNERRDGAYYEYFSHFIRTLFAVSEAYAQLPPERNAEGRDGRTRMRPSDPGKIRTTPSRLHLLAPPGQPAPPPVPDEIYPPGLQPGSMVPGDVPAKSDRMSPKEGDGPVYVKVEEDTVQVLAENIPFGEVMNAMAKEMGFRLKIPSDLSGKKVSISLYDVPVDRALIRLFSLVQEKNYKVKYSEDGSVTHVEVIEVKGSSEGPSAMPEMGERKTSATSRQPQRRYQPYRPPAVRPRSLPSRPPTRNVPMPGPEDMRPPE